MVRALSTADHSRMSSNPGRGRIQLIRRFFLQAFIATLLLTRYDLNNVERDVKSTSPSKQSEEGLNETVLARKIFAYTVKPQ